MTLVATARWRMNQRRLLAAARYGLLQNNTATSTSTSTKNNGNGNGNGNDAGPVTRPLRCFPLESEHIQDAFAATTPAQFHALLCQKIRSATRRVLLASLYVGPAACSTACPREKDLLDALQVAANKPTVQVQILLDKNRALRPVPTALEEGTTTSAQAVYGALQGQQLGGLGLGQLAEPHKNNLFLFSVLPTSLQYWLPNPYNEVAGVFHIKVYVIDDTLILSGANLSEEYFVDRHDRYLHFTKGGGGLVDFYHKLIQTLCQHAELYQGNGKQQSSTATTTTTTTTTTTSTRQQLLDALTNILTTDITTSGMQGDQDTEQLFANDKLVAVAVPTFQPPEYFFSACTTGGPAFPTDTQVTQALLREASGNATCSKAIVRLSSAYLNPTDNLLRVLAEFQNLEFLTAGKASHGFAPKKKAGNKGKDWIPSVFDTLSKDACQQLDTTAQLLHYDRPGWTFHAKGLWLLEESAALGDTTIVANICGSGNYGARSETLDMESNCVLILPTDSPLQSPLQEEWTNMLQYTNTQQQQQQQQQPSLRPSASAVGSEDESSALSWPLRVCLPIIRKFL
jgi:CDP-diacylglycerol---glycerol-3-phosphate 3-phosphatidyltransferase